MTRLDATEIIEWFRNYSAAVVAQVGTPSWRKFVAALWDGRKSLYSIRMSGREVAELLEQIAVSLRHGVN